MTHIFDVLLKRYNPSILHPSLFPNYQEKTSIVIYYDDNKEKAISEMKKYVDKNGFSYKTDKGTFSVADVILRERESTGKTIKETSYCEIFNTITKERLKSEA